MEGAPPIHINGTAVDKVESFKFLDVHIADKLKWSIHTLFNLRRLIFLLLGT